MSADVPFPGEQDPLVRQWITKHNNSTHPERVDLRLHIAGHTNASPFVELTQERLDYCRRVGRRPPFCRASAFVRWPRAAGPHKPDSLIMGDVIRKCGDGVFEVEYVSGQPDIAVGTRFHVHETRLFHCCECYAETRTSFEVDKLFMTKIEKMTRHLLQWTRPWQ